MRLRPRPPWGDLRLQDEVTVLTLRHLPSFRVSSEAATRRAVSRRQPAKSFITGSPPGQCWALRREGAAWTIPANERCAEPPWRPRCFALGAEPWQYRKNTRRAELSFVSGSISWWRRIITRCQGCAIYRPPSGRFRRPSAMAMIPLISAWASSISNPSASLATMPGERSPPPLPGSSAARPAHPAS